MAESTTPIVETSEPLPAVNGTPTEQQDVQMKEEHPAEAPLSSPLPPATITETAPPSQPHSRPHTPAARASPHPSATPAPPSQPNPHGSPTRVYLNQNVTPHLLEGMKYLAVYEPEKPLKWLSEFLEKKSREVEGG